MTYRVFFQRLARADLAESYNYAARRAPLTAGRWLDRFQRALGTLARKPERCPFARENGKVELELREFHFGKRPNVFRVIYTIDGALPVGVPLLDPRRGAGPQRRVPRGLKFGGCYEQVELVKSSSERSLPLRPKGKTERFT